VLDLVGRLRPAIIVHAAVQPSHDRAAAIPFDDFDTNAVGTLNLLEAVRQACLECPFIHLSTNKLYGHAPNQLNLTPLGARWITLVRNTPRAFLRPSRLIRACTVSLAQARSRPTCWCRNMAGTLICPPAAFVAAVSRVPITPAWNCTVSSAILSNVTLKIARIR